MHKTAYMNMEQYIALSQALDDRRRMIFKQLARDDIGTETILYWKRRLADVKSAADMLDALKYTDG